MSWLFYAVIAVVSLYLYSSIPKPKSAAPPGLEDVKAPSTDQSRDIPVIFGTVDIAPHVEWYGDMAADPIRERAGK